MWKRVISTVTHWSRRPIVRDVALVAALLIGTLAISEPFERFEQDLAEGALDGWPLQLWVWWAATAGQMIAVLARRRWPIPALAVAAAGALAQMAIAAPVGFVNLAAPIILAMIALGYRRTVSIVVLGMALGVAIGWTAYVSSVRGPGDEPILVESLNSREREQLARMQPAPGEDTAGWILPERVAVEAPGPQDWGGLVALIPALIAGWGIGSSVRSRRAYLDELHARARDLERERDQQAALVAATERTRITRELHDVVAHGLSVMVVQAQGGAAALDNRPADSREAFAAIIKTGRRSLADMRGVLGVIGAADGDVDGRYPQPGLGDLARLIRDAGTPVLLHVEGAPQTLPAVVDLSSYRIIQEAVTNVVKHAGPGARTQVFLSYEEDVVRVEVADNGRGVIAVPVNGPAGSGDGPPGEYLDRRFSTDGNGLRGMRERAESLGGSFAAGPGQYGGFVVRAELPITERTGE